MKAIFITKDNKILVRDVPSRLVFVEAGRIIVRDGVPSEEAVNEWITINGAAVHIGANGEIDKGAGGKFNGQKAGEQTSKKTYKFRYDHHMEGTKRMREKGHEIPKGSLMTGVKVIAGEGKVKQASSLTKRYKVSDPTKWKKVRGNVNVRFPNGEVVKRQVHYYYHPEVGDVDYKFPTNKKQT